jgi:hypothetical protein
MKILSVLWLCWRSLGPMGLLLLLALALFVDRVYGAECPPGMVQVKLLMNEQVIYEGCRAAAVVCRVLIPRDEERR